MPAPQTIVVNESDLRRIARARQELVGSLDAKRTESWVQFGYKADLTFQDFWNAYRRGGAGHGAVHRLLDKCWAESPRVKKPAEDAETPWEESVEAVLRAINGWAKLRDFDRRNMVGRYAGLIMRVADNQALNQPLKRGALRDLVPCYEDQLRVSAWDNDAQSETFGKPTMWEFRSRRPQTGDNQAAPEQWAQVHPSRVLILAEGSVGDHLDGVPLLEAGFNNLVDLEKIAGGSAEGFLKNSQRALTIKFDAQSSPTVLTKNPDGTESGKEVGEVVREQVDKLNSNIDSALVFQGADVGTLQTSMPAPDKPFEVAANLFAASVQIPFTILFGQQTGRLASDQDRQDFAARCAARQQVELTPMLEDLIRRLQAIGAIEAGEFEIEWPRVDAPSEKDKVEILGKMTGAMEQAFQAGAGLPLFTVDELRAVVDYEAGVDLPDLPIEGDPNDPAPVVPPSGSA